MRSHTRKPVVFVVDDDESVLRSLGRLIRAEGLEARLFASAEQFLAEVVALPDACVVLDVTMPRVSGFDVQRRLTERGIELPMIIVSARDDDATRRAAKQCGAKFFLRKPVDERSLIDAIDWSLGSDVDEAAE